MLIPSPNELSAEPASISPTSWGEQGEQEMHEITSSTDLEEYLNVDEGEFPGSLANTELSETHYISAIVACQANGSCKGWAAEFLLQQVSKTK